MPGVETHPILWLCSTYCRFLVCFGKGYIHEQAIPHSTDLTAADSFLWRYLKVKAYVFQPKKNMLQLKTNFRNEIMANAAEILRKFM